jgi:hypothetical protein
LNLSSHNNDVIEACDVVLHDDFMNDDLVMESFGYPQYTIDTQYLVHYYYKEIMLCYLVIFLGCNPMNLELSYYLWCQGNLSPPSSTLFSINHLYVEVNFILKESMERRISTSKQKLKRFDVLKAQEFKLGANNLALFCFVLFCVCVCACACGLGYNSTFMKNVLRCQSIVYG